MVGRFLWLSILLVCIAVSPGWAVCGNLVHIPIEISFRDSRYNTESILRSLEPQLLIGLRRLQPTRVDIASGQVVADFCVAQGVIDNASEIVGKIGSEEHSLAIRPITNRRMTKINWLHPTAPTWTVVQSVSWSTLPDGRPVLDLQLFNYSAANEQPAIEFKLLLLGDEVSKDGQCFAPAAIPVEIDFVGGQVEVFSGGATYPEPTRKPAQFWPASCEAPHRLTMSLGPTRPIAAGKASELRFIFGRSALQIPGMELDALALSERRIEFAEDSGVYPRHAPLQTP